MSFYTFITKFHEWWRWVALGLFGIITFLLVALAVLLVIPGAYRPDADGAGPKLLLLGIDAADWDIVDQLLAAGRMPNLQALIDRGVSATPRTLNPTISPAIWTTTVTGKLPAKHGIQNFIVTSPDSYKKQLVTSDLRRAKALWNIFSDRGDEVGVYGFWATWPPEGLNGYTVTDLALFDPEKGIEPPELKSAMTVNTVKTLGIRSFTEGLDLNFPEPTSINDASFFEVARQKISTLDQVFNGNDLFAFDRYHPDALIQISGTIDAAQHLFLKFRDPDNYPLPTDPALIEEYGDFINQLYVNQDNILGEFIKRAGGETHIIVMSDHGIFMDPASGFRFKKFDDILSRLGYLTYDGNGQIDFGKTIAFECNNNNFDWQRRLCINLQGRYGSGIVPRERYDALRSEIIAALETLVTIEGESLFYSVEAVAREDADVVYDIRRDLVEKTLVVAGQEVPVRNFLELSVESGNHYSNPEGPDGIFVWAGPNIRRGVNLGQIEYVDITPNVLHALGMAIGEDMDGDYLPSFFEHPTEPAYIETYESEREEISFVGQESYELNDHLTSEDGHLYIHSAIEEGDVYDQMCFDMPSLLDKQPTIYIAADSPQTDLAYVAWDNPEITHPVAMTAAEEVEDLPQLFTTVIPPNDFVIAPEEAGKYNIFVPLSLEDPSYLALWTNMGLTVNSPRKGATMRLVGRGEAFQDIYPTLRVTQGSWSTTITLDSRAFAPYDLLVPDRGPVRIDYVNDALSTLGDRNAYVQLIKFGTTMPSVEGGRKLFLENGALCLLNAEPGTLELNMLLREEEAVGAAGKFGEEALELLQETGELREEYQEGEIEEIINKE